MPKNCLSNRRNPPTPLRSPLSGIEAAGRAHAVIPP
nr:MAG TPA: hypothetical protein [Caudoviricetes sp.]